MNRITLRQLSYFLAIAESGSIAVAAEKLGASPPAVSTGVKTLENILNVELFARHHARGVTLTSAGVKLLEPASRLVTEATEIENLAKSVSDDAVGTVRLGCYPTLAPIFIPALMQQVQQNYPGIDLQFVEGTERRLLPMLENGEIDLALCYGHVLPNHLMRKILHKVPMYCLLPEQHELALREGPVSLQELVNYPMVLLDTDASRSHFLGEFEKAALVPKIAHKTPSFEVLRGMVGRDLGYSLLMTQTYSNMTYDGHKVVMKPISDNHTFQEVCLTRLSTSRLPKVTTTIMELCKSISVSQYEAFKSGTDN